MTLQKNMATKKIDIPTKVHKDYTRNKLAQDFYKWGFTKGAEIGVRHGRFSRNMCEYNPNLELLCVDPYDVVYQEKRSREIGKEGQVEIYEYAKKKLEPYNATIIKKLSVDASIDIPNESLDFVYIDGGHQFDYVMTDIILWGQKIKKGGILSGHDYYKFIDAGVVRAVDNYAAVHGVKEINLTDESTPTWWFKRTW